MLRGQTFGQFSFTEFVYDSPAHTATWKLPAALGADDLTLELSDDVTDLAGTPLDGEWENPVDVNDPASDEFPSGDGAGGGPFTFRFVIAEPTPDRSVDLDIDGDGHANAMTDGILIVRYLFGLTGAELTAGDVLSEQATRTTPESIAAFLEDAAAAMLDADGSGSANALTDGILIVRYLFGLTGADLVTGDLFDSGAQRTDPAEIRAFLAQFMPSDQLSNSAGAVVGGNDGEDDLITKWLGRGLQGLVV